jgi:DNA-binding protein H-NS
MAKTYAQIQEQIATLHQEAAAARQREIAGVVKRINVAIRHYGIAPADLDFPSSTSKPTKGNGKARTAVKSTPKRAARKIAPKYRDDKGNTWAARGSLPRWLREAIANGKTLESFAVQ